MRILIILLFIGVLSSCSTPAVDEAPSPSVALDGEPEAEQVPGIISYYEEGTEDVLTVPDTVSAGESFEATVTTFGGGCDREGDANVNIAGTVATIEVYDYTIAGPAISCPAILKRLARTVTLSFSEAGVAVVRVEGRRIGQDTPGDGVPTTLEKQVIVQ